MNNTTSRRFLAALLAIVAAGLFLASLRLPLWHLKMEAPQYQDKEALKVRVYPGSLAGDLKEIRLLNQYIGVRIPEELPQLRWLHWALIGSAILGVMGAGWPAAARQRTLFGCAAMLAAVIAVSSAMAQWQMHRIGHNRAPHPALAGIADFTPPLLGKVKVANFEITTGLGVGALLIATGLLCQLGAGMLSGSRPAPAANDKSVTRDSSGTQLAFRRHPIKSAL